MGQAIMLIGLFFLVLLMLSYPLGKIISQVAHVKEKVWGLSYLRFLERGLYRWSGINQYEEMNWKTYALALMLFNGLGAICVYLLQRIQFWLPLNPQNMANVNADSAFNTAVSFVTNTNWQAYSGEASMSYLTQMLVLAGQNFFSAATGIAVVFALIRGFSRHSSKTIGNFWVDVTRSTIYLLLPLSFIFAIFLVSQGVIQNFSPYKEVQLLEPITYSQPVNDQNGQPMKDEKGIVKMETVTTSTQLLPMGPVASQEAIKLLGTNGGGFFNANSTHPFENPTALSNFFQMIAIFLIPAGLCFAFGHMVGDPRQGRAIFISMSILFLVMSVIMTSTEKMTPPAWDNLPIDATSNALQSGGNMEGKETRFGLNGSSLFVAVTTAASCGAVNAMHDSLTPLGGMIPLVLMQFGEVVFGGVGSGLYGMLIFAILTVFIAGLMIGRTPEYLGKKIQVYEMKMTSIAILVTPTIVLALTALAVSLEVGKAGILNAGSHGFSEILYAFTSAANNNGSAFAGLSANTPFYNTALAVAMWFGRFAVIIPVLAIAGSLANKKRLEANSGTFPTHGTLFIGLLVATVVLIGVLNYVPALALGPVVEHLQFMAR